MFNIGGKMQAFRPWAEKALDVLTCIWLLRPLTGRCYYRHIWTILHMQTVLKNYFAWLWWNLHKRVTEHIRHKLGCSAVVTDFQFYLTLEMHLYHTQNNIPSHSTELVSSDIALFNFWSMHKCHVCMCHDTQYLTGRKYTYASVVKIYACSFSLAFWMWFGSGLKYLDGGAHMWVRCLYSHYRLWRQGTQHSRPHSAAGCHPHVDRICPSVVSGTHVSDVSTQPPLGGTYIWSPRSPMTAVGSSGTISSE